MTLKVKALQKKIEKLQEEIVRLKRGNTEETPPEWKETNLITEQANEIDRLLEEVTRLKRGDFTPEEFQKICHNLPEDCKREDFEKGCKEYQEKLFGK